MDTRRGFTDHEHLDEAEIIHMNGRVYDYNVGRFMSVDPVIQSPENSQSINPYSYIMNNPLSGTDPSGYCSTSDTVKSCFDGVEKGTKQNITNNAGDVVGSVSKDTDGNVSVASNGAMSNGGQGTINFSAEKVADIGSTQELAQKPNKPSGTAHQELGIIGSSRDREVVDFNGTETACAPACLLPPLSGSTAIGVGAASNGVGNEHTENIAKGAESILKDLAGGGAGSPPPPDDESELQNVRSHSPEKVRKFNNKIAEQYHNTPSLRQLVYHNGKWRTIDGGGNMFTARGEYEFVTINRKVYVGRVGTGHYNISHGSQTVDYAGHVRFTSGSNRGILRGWNNNSGHYKPTADRAWQANLPLEKFNKL